MYKKILATYNGSKGSKNALVRALTIAREYSAPVTMVWVRDRLPSNPLTIGEVDEDRNDLKEYFGKFKKDAQNLANQYGIKIQCTCLKGSVASAIIKYAEDNEIDLIVIGKRGDNWITNKLRRNTIKNIEKTINYDVLDV
jgi:nucleotide-binding universal stress UspA family protein